MTKLFLLSLIISNFAGYSFSAELSTGSSTNHARDNNRFLFVVETSQPMSRMSKAAAETVRDLIGSGVQGQMRPGDTFGIWTFNEQLSAEFPMQQWTPGGSEKFAQISVDFLKKKRFEKKGVLQSVLQPLFPVLKSSRAITVILISAGSEPMRGTPFDQEINSIYPVYSSELREAKLPFVTILVGRSGKLVAHSVNSSLGPIKIPNPPIETAPVVTRPTTNGATALPIGPTNPIAKPKPVVPNIIVAKPIETNTIVEVVPANTNLAVKVVLPVAVVKTNVTAFIATPAKEVGTTQSVSNANANANSSAIKSETTFVAGTNSQTTTITTPLVAKISAPLNSSEAKSPLSNAVSLIKNQEMARFDDPSKGVSLPITPSKPAVKIEQESNRQNDALIPKSITKPLEVNAASTSPPAVAAKIIAKPKSLLWSVAALLLVIAIVVFLLVRRSHNKPQSSLISRSMGQRK
ncbi:MAG: hypothetical protein ABIP71_06670 [Verrucomicrobiota bacterium]